MIVEQDYGSAYDGTVHAIPLALQQDPLPLALLLKPDLRVLVNLGHGGDNLGYSDTAANVPTPFGAY